TSLEFLSSNQIEKTGGENNGAIFQLRQVSQIREISEDLRYGQRAVPTAFPQNFPRDKHLRKVGLQIESRWVRTRVTCGLLGSSTKESVALAHWVYRDRLLLHESLYCDSDSNHSC